MQGTDGDYRRIFEMTFHDLPRDVRASAARTAEGAALSALCFDPDPQVIRAVLENAVCGLQHARLIAAHHGHSAGLFALVERAVFSRDAEVRRLLLRNGQTPDSVLRRILGSLALQQLFQFNISRENSERAKRMLRSILRRQFMRAQAEERVGLIFKTEGRCLNLLIGLTFDSKTTALLCRRAYQSTLMIQNLARFPGTPPALIMHLLKQQIVRRSQPLRGLLLRHHNCPADQKRQG